MLIMHWEALRQRHSEQAVAIGAEIWRGKAARAVIGIRPLRLARGRNCATTWRARRGSAIGGAAPLVRCESTTLSTRHLEQALRLEGGHFGRRGGPRPAESLRGRPGEGGGGGREAERAAAGRRAQSAGHSYRTAGSP